MIMLILLLSIFTPCSTFNDRQLTHSAAEFIYCYFTNCSQQDPKHLYALVYGIVGSSEKYLWKLEYFLRPKTIWVMCYLLSIC